VEKEILRQIVFALDHMIRVNMTNMANYTNLENYIFSQKSGSLNSTELLPIEKLLSNYSSLPLGKCNLENKILT
jgi:hypothetical protein